MPRPPLPIGTWGKINTYRIGPNTCKAEAKYRDFDGVTRRVGRVGATANKAADNLRAALRDRGKPVTDGEITPDSRFAKVAELWLRDLAESGKATRTKETYTEVWHNLLEPAAAALRVADFRKVSTADRIIRAIRDANGIGRARHARIVLAGMCSLAVRLDALDDNPVRELTPAPRKRKSERRADRKIVLTVDSVSKLRAHMAGSTSAARNDLVDVVDVLTGVGCRIGELLALDWSKLEFEAGTMSIEGTVIRVKGVGLIVQPHTKSEAGMRTIRPASWVMEIVKGRYAERTCDWVFPSSADTLRDPDNLRKQLRNVVAETEWAGLHPHAFRHFVSTRLDEAGWTARQIADYLGHDRISTTQDEYMDRHVAGEGSTEAMPEIEPKRSGKGQVDQGDKT
ncbi:MAG: site-specific integrase [Actinophytocola sp.]|uniref:site-specific integrase n=1 Tax=Actinophytocola sp. TaxID=1872138 RepID=UPI003D6B9FE6